MVMRHGGSLFSGLYLLKDSLLGVIHWPLKGRGEVMKFLQMVVDGFWVGVYFSDSVDVHIYEKKILFFHHISSFLTTVWLLLQNFHPETSFVIRPFRKAGLVKVCLLFCPFYYTWIANIACISKVKSNASVCWSHC